MILFDRLLVGLVLTAPLHIPLNYNEAWNAGVDTRAVTPAAAHSVQARTCWCSTTLFRSDSFGSMQRGSSCSAT
jgi:hypothetical protein